MPPHVFAVDGQRLRYGRFARLDGSFDFQEFQETGLEPETFHPGPLGGTVKDVESLRERLGLLLETITAPVGEASLVLPDAWLRLAFTELEELPRRLAGAEEVLRWKLKKQVPFRVDELRLRGTAAVPLGGGGYRVLLGYAMEQLLSQLEDLFEQLGVRIGLTVNASQALAAALGRAADRDQRISLVLVNPSGYSLLFLRGGELVFHRFRAIGEAQAADSDAGLVRRDLKLTRDFLQREIAEPPPRRFVVVAPQESEERWRGWLTEAFEADAEGLRAVHLPLRGEVPAARLPDIAPLLGAACHQV